MTAHPPPLVWWSKNQQKIASKADKFEISTVADEATNTTSVLKVAGDGDGDLVVGVEEFMLVLLVLMESLR